MIAYLHSVENEADFDYPLEILEQCHDGIAHHCQTMQRLAKYVRVHGVDASACEAAAKVIEYFDTVASAHYEDEEVDLFPRLLQAARDATGESVALLIARLTTEHREIRALWQILRADLERIVRGRGTALRESAVAQFDELHRRHMLAEEEQLKPLRSLLSRAELAAIGDSMARRRGIWR